MLTIVWVTFLLLQVIKAKHISLSHSLIMYKLKFPFFLLISSNTFGMGVQNGAEMCSAWYWVLFGLQVLR